MEVRFSRSLLPGSHMQGSLVDSHRNSGFTDLVCIEDLHNREHAPLCGSQSNSVSTYTGGEKRDIQHLDFFPWNCRSEVCCFWPWGPVDWHWRLLLVLPAAPGSSVNHGPITCLRPGCSELGTVDRVAGSCPCQPVDLVIPSKPA